VNAAAPAAAKVAARGRSAAARRRRRLTYYGLVLLFMSPWLVGFVCFFLYPMIASLYYSFNSYDGLSSERWVGLANYRFMFTKDPFFWTSVRNTLWIVLIAVPIQLAFAMGTAMLLTAKRRGVRFYRTLYYLPTMAPPVAAILAFVYVLNPDTGPLDSFLSWLGWAHPPLWFFDPTYAKPGVLLLLLWGIGQTMIIMLAGLLDVPISLYESARIDGAGAWQRFRHITIPMLSPVIFFTLVIGMITAFQTFTEGYLTGNAAAGTNAGTTVGDPQNSLLFYAVWLYQRAFAENQLGYASAMAWVLFGATMVCTLVLMKTSHRWVHYKGAIR
jgi:multiple sugar transport system permease protein